MEMITIEEIRKNLIGQSIDDVREIFEDYEFEGNSDVIISEINDKFYSHSAYVNSINAPEIRILIDEEGMITRAEIEV